jgi:membrane protein DedA with SNARE-associated domain
MFSETEITKKIIEFANTYQAWIGPLVFALAFGESIAFVSLILPFWGILVALGAVVGAAGGLQFWTILICAAVGAALGDWVSYWLGKHYHKEIEQMWPIKNNPGLMDKGRAFFDRWGPWAIVIARFSGPLRAAVPIVAGAVRMPQGIFQLANWGSAFLWAGVLMVFGDVIGKGLKYFSGG